VLATAAATSTLTPATALLLALATAGFLASLLTALTTTTALLATLVSLILFRHPCSLLVDVSFICT